MTQHDDVRSHGPGIDRRDFLRRCACLALGGAGFSAVGRLELLQAAAAAQGPFTDYRALVCVFLFGGNDSFNMVVPRSSAEYTVYADSRQGLAIPQGQLLPLSPTVPTGAGDFGFHPSCPELASLFNAGRLAVVSNVGPLLYPTTRAQYLARSVPLPPQLFSHSDQTRHWQTARPDAVGNATGWAGRVSDVFAAAGFAQDVPLNVTINGSNTLQTGLNSIPYNVSTSGVIRLRGIDSSNSRNARRQAAFESLLNNPFDHPFTREFAKVQLRARDNANRIASALEALPALTTVFPTTSVGRQLEMVAKLIGIRTPLQLARQVFFVGQGGYDTHGEQATRQPLLLGDLSQALDAFDRALTELGVANDVVTFTSSDFGRTLTSNGDGSDHGWGAHHLVMGAPVIGRRFYGTLPDLAIGGADDTRGGRLIPTTSVDQYGATLATWLGVGAGELATVFPNLSRFSPSNLGFLNP